MKIEISYRTPVWHPQRKWLAWPLLVYRIPFILLAAIAVALSHLFCGLAVGRLASISMLATFFNAKADEMHSNEHPPPR